MTSTPRLALALLLTIAAAIGGCEGPTGPQGPVGEGPGALSDPAIIPKVVYTFPSSGLDGPYSEFYVRECPESQGCDNYAVIRLRFNKYMDAASLRAATRLTSSDGEVTLGREGLQPLGGDIWLVHPSTTGGTRIAGFMPIGQRFSLTVDTTARDVNGNRLAAPYTLAFTPEPSFRVVAHEPADGAFLGRRETSIQLAFNGWLDSSILSAIHIDPAPLAPFSWSLSGFQGMVGGYFRLEGSTRYTVTVDTNASDVRGNRLTSPFRFSFTSVPFSVQDISPDDGATNVSISSNISISFSEPIDTSTVWGAVRLSPPVVVEINYAYERYLNLHIREDLLPETHYTITIDSTLRSQSGGGLQGGFSSSFTTAPLPPLAVSYTSPADGQSGVNGAQGFYVSFNQEIDTATAPTAFHLAPGRPGRLRYGSLRRSFTFYPDLPLTAGQAFVATIDTTLRSAAGGRLPEPVRVSFTVQPLKVSWILPYDGRPDVPPAYPLQVWFRASVDTLTIPGAVRLDPPIAGSFRVSDGGFRFDPDDVWSGGVRYTVTIDTSLTALGGGRLEEAFTSSFTAAPFGVLQHIPPDGADIVPVNAPVWVYCNDGIDSSSAKAAFAMADSAGNAVTGWFGFSASVTDQFGFRPDESLTPGAWYDVTIGAALRSLRGHAIETPVHFRFRTAP
jgi:hypothetical protein